MHVERASYASLLRICGNAKALADGSHVHAQIGRAGYNGDLFLGNLLIQMYGKCGRPDDGRAVFERILQRNIFSWNLMIGAYSQNGQGKKAIQLFQQMQLQGVAPDKITFISILRACSAVASLANGKESHAYIIDRGFDRDVVVGNALVSMYGKCASLHEAKSVFDSMNERNVVSWNAMIAAYAQNGYGGEALQLFRQMQMKGESPDKLTFISILNACAGLVTLAEGKECHTRIIDTGFEMDLVLGNALVNMYGKCGSLHDARGVFDKIHLPNAVSWSTMIAAYAQNGHCREAIELFRQMQRKGAVPDKVTFIVILHACAGLASLAEGKESHASIIDRGCETDIVVGTALVSMYGRCESLEGAESVFDKMPQRNVVTWTAMIAAYSQNGHAKEALKLYLQMQLTGIEPNKVTFLSILDSCANLASLVEGKRCHASIINNGFEMDVTVGNALINMYGKCRSLENARKVFDTMPQHNVVSWNAMISTYSQNGHGSVALQLFQQMQLKGEVPNKITFIGILNACACLATLAEGKVTHASIMQRGFETDTVMGNTLIHMYGKCGSPDGARSIFDQMLQHDVVSWNAMIAAYTQNGRGKEVLALFQQMQLKGTKPNKITFISFLDACAVMAALREGKESHAGIINDGFEVDIVVGTALVNMYGKCGSVDDARTVFDNMPQHDAVLWAAMMGVYAQNGLGKEAIKLFHQMRTRGTKPDSITFINILSGCSHAGLLDDGWHYFVAMNRDYAVTPMVEHFVCMIDLFGRAGQLDEAENLINKMPFGPYAMSWISLLGACRIYGDVERGIHTAERLFELDPKNSVPYVLLSNIYAAAGQWGDVTKVREVMKNRGVKKKPGCSCIKVNERVHEFIVGDSSHPQKEWIHASYRA